MYTPDFYNYSTPQVEPLRDDLLKVAVSSLAGVDTDRAAMLAMEIQRGMDREAGRPEAHIEVPVEPNQTTPATIHQYLLWLNGYVQNGGRPTYSYTYPFGGRDWRHAQHRFAVNGECGDRSIYVIVEFGGEVINPNPWKPFRGWGHNAVFQMDGYTTNRPEWVPVYSDPEFEPYREMAKDR